MSVEIKKFIGPAIIVGSVAFGGIYMEFFKGTPCPAAYSAVLTSEDYLSESSRYLQKAPMSQIVVDPPIYDGGRSANPAQAINDINWAIYELNKIEPRANNPIVQRLEQVRNSLPNNSYDTDRFQSQVDQLNELNDEVKGLESNLSRSCDPDYLVGIGTVGMLSMFGVLLGFGVAALNDLKML